MVEKQMRRRLPILDLKQETVQDNSLMTTPEGAGGNGYKGGILSSIFMLTTRFCLIANLAAISPAIS